MNAAHWHLLINHLPIFGLFFVCALIVVALIRRTREMQLLTLWTAVVVAAGTIPTYLTGEPAEHVIGRMPGVSRAAIHAHEESAELSFVATEVLGALALVGIFILRNGRILPGWYSALLLLLGIVSAALIGYTSNLGGVIRHPEIGSTASQSATPGATGGATDSATENDERGERGRGRGDDD